MALSIGSSAEGKEYIVKDGDILFFNQRLDRVSSLSSNKNIALYS